MKKHLSKILIVIFILTTFLGFFGITKPAEAQSTILGLCHDIPAINRVAQPDKPNVTYKECFDLTPTLKSTPWTPNGSLLGTCTVAGNQKYDITSADCVKLTPGITPIPWIQNTNQTQNGYNLGTESTYEFDCGITNLPGCAAQVLNLLWSYLASPIARAAGHFLDFFVYYSTNSSSYTSEFISKGWGAIRDVANIFFIITLLYIALKMILSLDEHGNKKMIGSVIVIALIINFSLFTTKVIIDSSNILAKVFYNSITSINPEDSKNKDGTPKQVTGDGGERSISLGLISKFNPQKIVSPSMYVDHQADFIFIAFIALIVTLYTAYIFFSVALLFVSRVVSLWISMIFSPIAFISYAVPFDLPFGHKEWWDDFLKNAFLAPIFIFFLYIIIMFAGFLSKIVEYPDGASTAQRMMGIVIPFALLAMLLGKSKKLAEKWSGKMGEAVIGAAKIVGGLAVGGAGLGIGATALLGRTAIGRTTAAVARRPGVVDHAKARLDYDKKYAEWEKGGKTNAKPVAPAIPTSLLDRLGARINASQMKTGEVDHSRHEIDEAKKKAGFENVENAFLTGADKEKIQSTFVNDKRPEIEKEIRRGYDGKGRRIDKDGKPIPKGSPEENDPNKRMESESEFKERRYVDLEANSADEKKALQEKLNQEFNEILRKSATEVGNQRFSTLEHESQESVSLLTRATSKTSSGTYDVRNIPGAKVDKRDSLGLRAMAGLTTAVAAGMRMGLKKTTGTEMGSGQGNFLKDLKQTLSESLKNMKIDIKIDSSGGHAVAHGPSANAHAPTEDTHKSSGHKPSGGGHGGEGHH